MIEYSNDAQAIIDSDLHILHSNQHWQALTHSVPDLVQQGAQLRILDSDLRRALQKQMKACDSLVGMHPAEYFYRSCNGLLRFRLQPTRYQFVSAIGTRSLPAFLLSVNQPGPPGSTVHEDSLMQAFRLTPAEASIVAELCAGLTTQQIAEHRNTNSNTIRQQIKSCLAKTNSQNQTALVAKVLTIFS